MCSVQAPGERASRAISPHTEADDQEGKEEESGEIMPRPEPHKKNGMPSESDGDVLQQAGERPAAKPVRERKRNKRIIGKKNY